MKLGGERHDPWLMLVPGERRCLLWVQRASVPAIGEHREVRAVGLGRAVDGNRDPTARAVRSGDHGHPSGSHSIGRSTGRACGAVDVVTTVSTGVIHLGSLLDRTANTATATTAAAAARSPATGHARPLPAGIDRNWSVEIDHGRSLLTELKRHVGSRTLNCTRDHRSAGDGHVVDGNGIDPPHRVEIVRHAQPP